jgi:hypothetical protein
VISSPRNDRVLCPGTSRGRSCVRATVASKSKPDTCPPHRNTCPAKHTPTLARFGRKTLPAIPGTFRAPTPLASPARSGSAPPSPSLLRTPASVTDPSSEAILQRPAGPAGLAPTSPRTCFAMPRTPRPLKTKQPPFSLFELLTSAIALPILPPASPPASPPANRASNARNPSSKRSKSNGTD